MDTTLTIATVVPNDYYAPWAYVQSMLNLQTKYNFLSVRGCDIRLNRNMIIHQMKETGGDLLFIDSDCVFSEIDVVMIKKQLADYGVVTGLYALASGKVAIFDRVEGDYEFTDVKDGIFEIGACGAGFLGISEKIIKELPDNPFDFISEGTVTHGEDVSFCHRVRELGHKIYADSSILIGHCKTHILRVGDNKN